MVIRYLVGNVCIVSVMNNDSDKTTTVKNTYVSSWINNEEKTDYERYRAM